jgi:hypothetical protein
MVYDPESHTIKQVHCLNANDFNVKTMETQNLTSDSVIPQDMPASIINSEGGIDPKKVKLVPSYLKEIRKGFDSKTCAAI